MKLTLKNAQTFAKENFSKMSKIDYNWNLLHTKYIIKASHELTNDKRILSKLKPLAYVHDIGKIIEDSSNHAQLSLEVLKNFELDEIDRDCILNHGSTGKPISQEAKIFRAADGLSLFYKEVIDFIIKIESKEEGKSIEEITNSLNSKYKRYMGLYFDYPKALEILSKNFNAFQK